MGRKYKVVKKKPIVFVDDEQISANINDVSHNIDVDAEKGLDVSSNSSIGADSSSSFVDDDKNFTENVVDDTQTGVNSSLNEVPVEDDTLFDDTTVDNQHVLDIDNFDDTDLNFIVPDKFMVGLPEDANLPPMLYFYKNSHIVLAYPLSQENLAGLYPVLDGIYIKPLKKVYSWKGFMKWMGKHKFTAGVLIILSSLIAFSLVSSAIAGLGF